MNKFAVVTGIVVVVAVGVYLLVTLTGNTAKTLDLAGTTCAITTNAADKNVQVKKNKKVTWTVKNACASAQTVMLGNFRTVEASSRTTCTDPTEGGAEWPFKAQDQDNRSVTVPAGSAGDIVLKEAKNTGSTSVTYYFHICLGGVKIDPRLVIDP